MDIELKKLTLENFKKIKNLTVEFEHNTSISGDNKLGKTTIFDAFIFLLFGKDSLGSKEFNIKTLDGHGKAIPKLEHSVEGILLIDGVETTLKRIYREKWTRRRGAETSTLTGHETLFFWNDVPLQANEYKKKVSEVVEEGLFKLLTSTLYFNSLKWEDRRRALIMIAGEVGNADIVKGMSKTQVEDITKILDSGKPLEEFRKEIAMRKRKLNDELKLVPSRVDEVQRGMPEKFDFDAIQDDIIYKSKILDEIEKTITDHVSAYQEQADKIQAIQDKIYVLKAKRSKLEFEAKQAWEKDNEEKTRNIEDVSQKLTTAERSLKENTDYSAVLLESQKAIERKIADLRQQWSLISKEELIFKEGEFICPACGRDLDEDTIIENKEKMIKNFDISKSHRLSEIKKSGELQAENSKNTDQSIEENKKTIDGLMLTIKELSIQFNSMEAATRDLLPLMTLDANWIETNEQIEALELKVLDRPKLDVDSLKEQKSGIRLEIDGLKASLTTKDVIARAEARIKELLGEEESLAQQIADLEKSEFAMTGYIRSKMDLVEKRVNARFGLVKWKMFNVLLNGAVEETCVCMIDGVPYPDMNSAARIQSGIDIINTLSKHYGVTAPIFVDNAESINDLPETKSQLIRLVVTKDKELIIK